ncbi:hypothetical protein EGR_02111 [Echinococcus granulosus]|uniref:Uncharacterized protein n=1 Tax=Echinococcus granulosus TaxID=6210 RepID=W6UWY5_ECHGR|nr:hypothetical protein EGR_02111 [Echinococcus granulosus]EUB63017.1 hypothetical protein EGR_02111 [Echinococcus granulosus]
MSTLRAARSFFGPLPAARKLECPQRWAWSRRFQFLPHTGGVTAMRHLSSPGCAGVCVYEVVKTSLKRHALMCVRAHNYRGVNASLAPPPAHCRCFIALITPSLSLAFAPFASRSHSLTHSLSSAHSF